MKAPIFVRGILGILILFAGATSAAKETAPAKEYTVKITFDYKNIDEKMEIWSVKPDAEFDISETRRKKSRSTIPVIEPIGPEIKVKRGEGLTFALVVENKSSQTKYFFAAPHTAQPETAALRFKFLCLCNHHVFNVPPGRTWYRIVRLELDREYDSSKLELRHTVVGVSPEQAKTTYKSLLHTSKDAGD